VKVVHVVNLVDEVGSYGGPLRVALNQVAALRELGHDVELVAGASPTARRAGAPAVTGTVPVRLHRSYDVGRRRGFAARWSPGLHLWLLRHARRYDVVHVHLGRDLTTAPVPSLLRALKVPHVVQTHGMVAPTPQRAAHVVDTVLTRPSLRGAGRVLALTERERDDLAEVTGAGTGTVEVLPNGVSSRLVAGGGRTDPPEVLFLSRIQARKRPLAFVRAAQQLRADGVRARFTLVGPDEGELAAVRAAVASVPDEEGLVRYEGAVPMDGTLERMARADVFVMPSVDEPFSMVLAEAMSQGLPVVCTASCGLAPAIRDADAGVVVDDGDDHALAEAVRGLLDDPVRARACGENGRRLVEGTFSITAVARRLEHLYLDLARSGPVAR
jgi:glycosyltransferase involved in cell wall biosynthesis